MIPYDNLSRAELESLYVQLVSAVVVLARLLGKPCPVQTRADRRAERQRSQREHP